MIMNYFKLKMDDDNKAFIIVFCFLLLGLFIIVPIVLLVFSHNLRMFYLYEGLSFSNIILIVYCLAVLIVAGFFLYMVYKSQNKEIENNLNILIDKRLKGKGLTDKNINKKIENKLAELGLKNNTVQARIANELEGKGLTHEKIQSLINWWITLEPEDTKLKDFIIQVLKNNKILS